MKLLWGIVGVCFLAISLYGCGLVGIEDGQGGVKEDFGKIADEASGTGWHFYIVPITWIEKWNIKTQEIKETASIPSSEGLISTLDVSVLFNTPKDKIISIRKTIGKDYKETVVQPYIREAIRSVASGYPVAALYSEEGRTKIAKQIKEYLISKLFERGIIIQDVLLRDVRLPYAFSVSIENKLKTEQEALQKQFELEKAKKDAEIEVVRAKGVAQSNEIIAGSITEGYLRYLWIQGLQTNQMQVIYVPTEANLPIMEAGRWKEYKKGE